MVTTPTDIENPTGSAPSGRLVVAIEQRFTRVNGRVYSSTCTFDRFWKRYLRVFREVHVLARIAEGVQPAPGDQLADGPGVHWIPVPFFLGPWQYLRQRNQVIQVVREAAKIGDAFLLRVPGTIATTLWKELRRRGLPYGVEVVGDPYDVFAPGGNSSKLRPLFRVLFTRALRAQCQSAVVAAYVTRNALQARYPSSGWTTHYSSVELDQASFVTPEGIKARVRRYREDAPDREWVCAHVGSMSQIYKRQDALIRAIAHCNQSGIPVRLKLVGSGVLEGAFRKAASESGIESKVEFLGELPAGAAVRDVFDASDIFVLPSATEGLPRAVIEAMARGLPCLASNVGGTSELLADPERFDPHNLKALGQTIASLLKDPQRMIRLSQTNEVRAREYSAEILTSRRDECYFRLREETATSIASKRG